jgi:hypothetical protein
MHGQELFDSDASVDDEGDIDADLAAKVMRNGHKVDFDDSTTAEHFKTNKLHPCTVEWEYAVATDLALQARLFFMSKRKLDSWVDSATVSTRKKLLTQLGNREPTPADVTNELIRTWYTRINSHGAIEGHLPELVPLDYAEKIIMKSSVFRSMFGELAAYRLSDRRTLASIVVPLPDADYGLQARRWQKQYFDQRAAESAMRTAAGDAGAGTDEELDMRAFSFGIEELEGKDMFLPTLLSPEGFTLRFRVKGQHIRIAVTNRREETRNKDASRDFHVYFVCIGAIRNTKTYMKRSNKSGDPVVAQATRDENRAAMAWPDRYREYWLTYEAATGYLRLGHGGKDCVGQKDFLLLEYRDWQPHKDLQYVAISCWETPLDFAMLKDAGPPSTG